VAGGVLAHARIGIAEHTGVGIDEAGAALSCRYSIPEGRPLLGKHPAHVPCHPLNFPAAGRHDTEQNDL
jgi:hypothetical protein